jgi:hypothetical protein
MTTCSHREVIIQAVRRENQIAARLDGGHVGPMHTLIGGGQGHRLGPGVALHDAVTADIGDVEVAAGLQPQAQMLDLARLTFALPVLPSMRIPSDWPSLIRDVADFPKPGILFKDITPVLANADAFAAAMDAMAGPWRGAALEAVVGIESRGFIRGAALAQALGTGFVPVRKPGKLPGATLALDYALEYGSDRLEMHADALPPGARAVAAAHQRGRRRNCKAEEGRKRSTLNKRNRCKRQGPRMRALCVMGAA